MNEELRQILIELAAAIRDSTEQSFHAHELAERALAVVSGARPPDVFHIQNSKRVALENIDEVIRRRLSIFETAQALGLPHGTVKSRLARARAKIARHMRRVVAPGSPTPERLHKYKKLLIDSVHVQWARCGALRKIMKLQPKSVGDCLVHWCDGRW